MAGYGYVSPYNLNSHQDPFKGLNQNAQGGNGNPSNRLEGFDPRDIMQGDAYKTLLGMGKAGSGALGIARGEMQPALDYYKNTLASDSPLGSGRGELVRSQGFGAVSQALETGQRRSQEASTQYGRAADPEAMSFGQGIMRSRAGGDYGKVASAAQEVELNEKMMNEQFRAGMAQALSSAGMGLGSLAISDFNSRTSATGAALQSESFARNTAADLLTRILGYGAGSAGGPLGLSLEDRGTQRQLERRRAFGWDPQEDLWNFLAKVTGA